MKLPLKHSSITEELYEEEPQGSSFFTLYDEGIIL
jgi:hypothetical protein